MITMKNEILLLPLTRHEFNEARMGRIIQKRFGNNSCIVISDRFISFSECEILRKNGFTVFPLDITGVSWRNLTSKFKNNVIVQWENGLTVALVSQSVYNLFQKDRVHIKKKKKGVFDHPIT
jgi:hypothetical protein